MEYYLISKCGFFVNIIVEWFLGFSSSMWKWNNLCIVCVFLKYRYKFINVGNIILY